MLYMSSTRSYLKFVKKTNEFVKVAYIEFLWYKKVMEPLHIYREVGRNIKRYRKGVHRTQQQVAAAIGMSRASLANIEAGRQQVLVHHLFAIADALDLDSPIVLMLSPSTSAPQEEFLSDLPLPDDAGLTEKQRLEVRHLLSNVLNSRAETTSGGTVDEREKKEDLRGGGETYPE